jgi:hypothetical protein
MHEIQSEHWTFRSSRVLASMDYQASFCLFVDCAKVFEASIYTITDDIRV